MLFLTTCNGIRCVDDTQVELSTFEVTSNDTETIFINLNTKDRMMCQVYMEFDSIAQKFTLKFGQSVKYPRLRSVENTYIHIAISIIPADSEMTVNNRSIKTVVHLVCYSNHNCDRQLVLEHINWLIKTNYRNLESIIRPFLLVQGDKKDECTIGNGDDVKPCYNTACSWSYSMETKQNKGKCENIDPHTLPILHLTTDITLFEKHKNKEEEIKPIRAIVKHNSSIKFWCELNNCNNQKVGELVKEAVSKQYDIWAMDKIHGVNRQ